MSNAPGYQKTLQRTWIALAIFASPAARLDGQDLALTVHAYNMAQAPSATVERARKEANRLLGEAGVQLNWVDCPLTSAEMDRVPECQQLHPTNLTLRIIPLAATSLKHDMLGFALPDPNGAIHATVFYNRVEEISEATRVPAHLILGLGIAHEIGHLLLGSERHSKSGLMKAQWTSHDLELAMIEQLRFQRDQATHMQAETRERSHRAALLAGRR